MGIRVTSNLTNQLKHSHLKFRNLTSSVILFDHCAETKGIPMSRLVGGYPKTLERHGKVGKYLRIGKNLLSSST